MTQRVTGRVHRDWCPLQYYWDGQMSVQEGGLGGVCQVHEILKVSVYTEL